MTIIPENTTTHIVVIGEDDRRDNGPYFITPSQLVIRTGDKVIFVNLTKVPLSVKFDETERSQPLDSDNPFDVAIDEEKETNVLTGKRGVYKFDVSCGDDKKLAYGTRPIFIGFEI